MTVIDIAQAKADREPHLSGSAVCLACKHEWVAVAPVGTVWMECPACSLERGRYHGPVQLDRDHWHCHCGNDLSRPRKRDVLPELVSGSMVSNVEFSRRRRRSAGVKG